MRRKLSAKVLRDYARDLNNKAFHIEEEAAKLGKLAADKVAEAAEMRAKAKTLGLDADFLEKGQ
jgi:hypothetical protein